MLNYSWKASPNRRGRLDFNAAFSIRFWNGLYWYVRVSTLESTCGLLTHPGSVFRVKFNSVQLLFKGLDMMMSNFQKFKVQKITVHTCTGVCTGTYWYRNTLHLNHVLSTFRRRRVSIERLDCSSRPASFFRAVSSTVSPPRLGLPRPNRHSHWLTSYTLALLPNLSSAVAVLVQPLERPVPLCLLNLRGIVFVELPTRYNGMRGTLTQEYGTGEMPYSSPCT